MRNRLLREMHREDGYALVISMLLVSIMMVLLAVSLTAGTSSLRQSSLSLEWSKALTVAEAGVNDAVTLLGQNRSATNSCSIGSSNVCDTSDGQYQLRWRTSGSQIMIDSVGYYPTKAAPTFTRQVEVTYEPIPSFKYAIFSQTSVSVQNNMTVMGDVYSAGDVTVGQGAVVCGSITSSGGGVTLVNSSQVVKSYSALGCSGKSGNVWTGGTSGITGSSQVTVQGNLQASNPSTATCATNGTNYAIKMSSGGGSMAVTGTATACGAIDSGVTAASKAAGTSSSQPVPITFPAFTFDPNNYPSDPTDPLRLQCYPSGGTCGANDSTTATSDFNTYVAAHKTSLTGTFAVWQRSPSSSTYINLDGITLSGDFNLITNAPVNFGNTTTVSTTTSSISADAFVMSTYQPTGACTADLVNTGGADCSIYGKNAIEFDSGVQSNPDDGVVGLLYTTGKMAFVNSSNNIADVGDGALYAQSMDFKNGFNVIYNARVERVLGFGASYEQVLWQELNV
jgi:Tfp pilus assembly protein PilX